MLHLVSPQHNSICTSSCSNQTRLGENMQSARTKGTQTHNPKCFDMILLTHTHTQHTGWHNERRVGMDEKQIKQIIIFC